MLLQNYNTMGSKKDAQGNEITFLTPHSHLFQVAGRIFYSEGDQSWNTIRLKKEILQQFPQLKEKSSSFGYVMIIPRSQEEMKKLVDEKKESLPILLFFHKDVKPN